MNHLKSTLKRVTWRGWALLVIVLVGLFLRGYKMHDWLDFGSDQVNDATRVSAVVNGQAPWPLLGPDMSNSGTGGRSTRFRLGPMYYYFEIASAKIFGNTPDKLAYPDLLFTVLSIPLLCFFLRRYFPTGIALTLTGLYAISFYALRFSHSAWNVNSIPFFSVLLLLGLLEFLVAAGKPRWVWVWSVAFALGVGIQLHAILLVLFPATAFVVFIRTIGKDREVWKRWAVITLTVLVLNAGQIVSELKTGFTNSKTFVASLEKSPQGGPRTGILKNLVDDADCHIEANAYMLSSVGSEGCDFFFAKALQGNTSQNFLKEAHDPVLLSRMTLAAVFSLFGYGTLISLYRQERDARRKYFLWLTGLYASLSAFVLLPVIDAPFRYFNHTFFMPLLFLGFLIVFLSRKYPRAYVKVAALIALFFVATNILSLLPVASALVSQTRSGSDSIVLGEIEPLADYIIAQSSPRQEASLFSDRNHANFLKSIQYVASLHHFTLTRIGDIGKVSDNEPVFFISQSWTGDKEPSVNDIPFETFRNFNQIGVYVIRK